MDYANTYVAVIDQQGRVVASGVQLVPLPAQARQAWIARQQAALLPGQCIELDGHRVSA